MKVLLGLAITVGFVSLLAGYGCCKGCGNKFVDTDKIPGFKDSGVIDPHAVEEHQAEIEKLNEEIKALAEEQERVMQDPNLSPEEKQRRLEEIQKEMETKLQRIAEIGGDIMNKETEVNKDIEKWRKESEGK